jgi:hypothetical protein
MRISLCGAAAGSTVLWVPRNGGFAEIGIGVLGVALFPILLWLTGDPSVRDGFRLARRQMAKLF